MCVMLESMYRSLRAARAATFAYFAVNGFVMGTWVVHINVIARQAGVDTATLGYLLLALGGSAFLGVSVLGGGLGPGARCGPAHQQSDEQTQGPDSESIHVRATRRWRLVVNC